MMMALSVACESETFAGREDVYEGQEANGLR
jgi:hypothetical protein